MDLIKQLIEKFTTDLMILSSAEARRKMVEAINGPLMVARPDIRVGRIIAVTHGSDSTDVVVDRRARRKAPLQLCPVPRCRNAAAPVFGMLCAKHKGTPKRLVAKYRAARRARK